MLKSARQQEPQVMEKVAAIYGLKKREHAYLFFLMQCPANQLGWIEVTQTRIHQNTQIRPETQRVYRAKFQKMGVLRVKKIKWSTQLLIRLTFAFLDYTQACSKIAKKEAVLLNCFGEIDGVCNNRKNAKMRCSYIIYNIPLYKEILLYNGGKDMKSPKNEKTKAVILSIKQKAGQPKTRKMLDPLKSKVSLLPKEYKKCASEILRIQYRRNAKMFRNDLARRILEGALCIDKLVRLDGFDFKKEVVPALEWAVYNSFWRQNIYSLAQLRKVSSRTDLTKFQNIFASYQKENPILEKEAAHPLVLSVVRIFPILDKSVFELSNNLETLDSIFTKQVDVYATSAKEMVERLAPGPDRDVFLSQLSRIPSFSNFVNAYTNWLEDWIDTPSPKLYTMEHKAMRRFFDGRGRDVLAMDINELFASSCCI